MPTSPGGQRKDPRIGKRKPCPDLNSIEDMQERRKQRRLAKNRATAAVSRCGLCHRGLVRSLYQEVRGGRSAVVVRITRLGARP